MLHDAAIGHRDWTKIGCIRVDQLKWIHAADRAPRHARESRGVDLNFDVLLIIVNEHGVIEGIIESGKIRAVREIPADEILTNDTNPHMTHRHTLHTYINILSTECRGHTVSEPARLSWDLTKT
jgi:hypothetical protein